MAIITDESPIEKRGISIISFRLRNSLQSLLLAEIATAIISRMTKKMAAHTAVAFIRFLDEAFKKSNII
jgi:hypothetical protein